MNLVKPKSFPKFLTYEPKIEKFRTVIPRSSKTPVERKIYFLMIHQSTGTVFIGINFFWK